SNISGTENTNFTGAFPVKKSDREVEKLEEKDGGIEAKGAGVSVTAWILNFVPCLLLIGFYLFLFKQMQAGGAKAFSFGKSKAKLLTRDTPKGTFADVAGAHEAKQELQENLRFLREPQKFTKARGTFPQGAAALRPPDT